MYGSDFVPLPLAKDVAISPFHTFFVALKIPDASFNINSSLTEAKFDEFTASFALFIIFVLDNVIITVEAKTAITIIVITSTIKDIPLFIFFICSLL